MQAGKLDQRVAVEAPPSVFGGSWTPVVNLFASSEIVPGTDPLTASLVGTTTHRMKSRYYAGLYAGQRGRVRGRNRYFLRVDPDNKRTELVILAIAIESSSTLTLSRATGGYDPLTDVQGGSSQLTGTASAMALTPNAEEITRYEAQGWKLETTVTLLVDAGELGSFAPAPDDLVTWYGITHALKEVQTFSPLGYPFFYRLVVSR